MYKPGSRIRQVWSNLDPDPIYVKSPRSKIPPKRIFLSLSIDHYDKIPTINWRSSHGSGSSPTGPATAASCAHRGFRAGKEFVSEINLFAKYSPFAVDYPEYEHGDV